MRVGISGVIFLLGCAAGFIILNPAYGETIYTKDGKKIQAKISEKTDTTIWYEISSGDIVEENGIDISDVEKILNDDGSVSKYSPDSSKKSAPASAKKKEKK